MSGNAEMAAAWDGPEGDHWADHAERYEATSPRYRRALLAALDLGDAQRGARHRVRHGSRRPSRPVESPPQGSVLGVDLSSRMLAPGACRRRGRGSRSRPLRAGRRAGAPVRRRGLRRRHQLLRRDVLRRSGRRVRQHPPRAAARRVARDARLARPAAQRVGRRAPQPRSPPGATCRRRRPVRRARSAWPTASITHERLAGGRLPATSTSRRSTSRSASGRDADDAYSFVSTFGITRGLTARPRRRDTRTAALEQRCTRCSSDHETPDGVLFAARRGSSPQATNGEAR